MRSSRCAVSSESSGSNHGQSSSNAPDALREPVSSDAPLTLAPPSPPVDAGAAPALARVLAHETSAEEWSLRRPRAEISEAVRTQLKAAVDRRRQQGRATIAPALHRSSTGQPQGAESDLTPEARPLRFAPNLPRGLVRFHHPQLLQDGRTRWP